MTLNTSDERVQKEFINHVEDNQNRKSLFILMQVLAAFNICLQSFNYFVRGLDIIGFLVAVAIVVYISIVWPILRWRWRKLVRYNFMCLWVTLNAINMLGSIKLNPDDDSFFIKTAYNESFMILTTTYILFTAFLTYCEFKICLFFYTPLYLVSIFVFSTQQKEDMLEIYD